MRLFLDPFGADCILCDQQIDRHIISAVNELRFRAFLVTDPYFHPPVRLEKPIIIPFSVTQAVSIGIKAKAGDDGNTAGKNQL